MGFIADFLGKKKTEKKEDIDEGLDNNNEVDNIIDDNDTQNQTESTEHKREELTITKNKKYMIVDLTEEDIYQIINMIEEFELKGFELDSRLVVFMDNWNVLIFVNKSISSKE